METTTHIAPWYVTGFVDGEGCFSLFLNTERKKRKNGQISVYTYWVTVFTINLRDDDYEILEKIQAYFDCGTVHKSNISTKSSTNGNVQLLIKSRIDLVNKVIKHFDKYRLQAKKQNAYILWKKAVLILAEADKRRLNKFSKQALTEQENKSLLEIKRLLANMQRGKQREKALNTIFNKSLGKRVEK